MMRWRKLVCMGMAFVVACLSFSQMTVSAEKTMRQEGAAQNIEVYQLEGNVTGEEDGEIN